MAKAVYIDPVFTNPRIENAIRRAFAQGLVKGREEARALCRQSHKGECACSSATTQK